MNGFEKMIWCIFGITGGCGLFMALMIVGDSPKGAGMAAVFSLCLIAVPVIYSFYKKYSEEQKRKAPLTGEARRFHEIYMLAPEKSFSRLYNTKASRLLTESSYNMTNSARAEGEALIKEKGIRETSYDNYEIKTNMNCSELLSEVEVWISDFTRPELIQNRLIKFFEMIVERKTDKEKAELYAPIMEATLLFNDSYFKYMNDTDGLSQLARCLADEKHANITTTGLGFGIITTSVANAALFSALDTLERNRQVRNQTSEIWSRTNYSDTINADELYRNVMDLYKETYRNKIVNAVKTAFEKM